MNEMNANESAIELNHITIQYYSAKQDSYYSKERLIDQYNCEFQYLDTYK